MSTDSVLGYPEDFPRSGPSVPADDTEIGALEMLIEDLERSAAHLGFNASNTRRLYDLLELCQNLGHAPSELRVLAMLSYLHYCENDEFELRQRSREGLQLARRIGDETASQRFLAYWNQAEKMQRDFQRSWSAVVVIVILGTLGAASYALRSLVGQRAR